MINTLSKINLSKIGWEGGGSTSIWIMSVNILLFFFDGTPNDQEGRNEQKIVRKSCVEFSFSVIYRQAISA